MIMNVINESKDEISLFFIIPSSINYKINNCGYFLQFPAGSKPLKFELPIKIKSIVFSVKVINNSQGYFQMIPVFLFHSFISFHKVVNSRKIYWIKNIFYFFSWLLNKMKKIYFFQKTRLPQEPLCLFYFPQSVSLESSKQTYVNVQQEYKPSRISRTTNFRETIQKKTKEARLKDKEFWVKKRVKDRIIRRRMKEPIRNLKSYLFTTGE